MPLYQTWKSEQILDSTLFEQSLDFLTGHDVKDHRAVIALGGADAKSYV